MVTTQVHEWTASDTGEKFSVDSPDDVRIAGKLRSGAAVSVHIGQVAGANPGYRFVVHGMKGALMVTADGSPHAGGQGTLFGAQGDGEFAEIKAPQSDWVSANGLKGQSVNIGKLWASYAKSIQDGTTEFDPDFDPAVQHQRFVDAVQRASDTGQAQTI